MTIRNINNTELRHFLLNESKGHQFIDVRTFAEYKLNKIEGFINIPMKSLEVEADFLAVDLPVVLLCETGSRSMRAARILESLGFNELINVKGGLVAYKSLY